MRDLLEIISDLRVITEELESRLTSGSIERLGPEHIGLKLIRLAPTNTGDRSYTDEPIELVGFNIGHIYYKSKYVKGNISKLKKEEWDDGKWVIHEGELL